MTGEVSFGVDVTAELETLVQAEMMPDGTTRLTTVVLEKGKP